MWQGRGGGSHFTSASSSLSSSSSSPPSPSCQGHKCRDVHDVSPYIVLFALSRHLLLLNILSCPSHPEKQIKIQLVPPTGDVTALHTEYGLAKKEKEKKKRKRQLCLIFRWCWFGFERHVSGWKLHFCVWAFLKRHGTISRTVFTRLTYSADSSDGMTLQLHTVTSKGNTMTDHDLAPRGE